MSMSVDGERIIEDGQWYDNACYFVAGKAFTLSATNEYT